MVSGSACDYSPATNGRGHRATVSFGGTSTTEKTSAGKWTSTLTRTEDSLRGFAVRTTFSAGVCRRHHR
jgi:hypothetical protein